MKYAEIIKDNYEHHSAVPWWTKFAFHYTDVTNAVSILDSGFLYSRVDAEKLGLMHNDNASRQVIDMTKTETVANVRFYFRPLTPTQYYNEGFKHSSLRYDNDKNANVPVPVFLLFDLEKLLQMPETKFSELPQSGYGAELYNSEDEFQRFRFDDIYSDGYAENFNEIKRYRHAEILYPNAFNIDTCINTILCRNAIEQITLLNLLREKNSKAFYKYKPIIKVCKRKMFENNGLYVTDCQYHDKTLTISFSEVLARQDYIRRLMKRNNIDTLAPISARLELDWLNAKRVCYHNATEFTLNYDNTSAITFRNLPKISGAKLLRVQVYLEGCLMCSIEQPLESVDLIR